MTKVESAWGPMGKVHQGFWKAMGEPRKKMERKVTDRRPILRIVLNNTSIFKTILSALKGAAKILHFLSINLFHHVNEPIDSTWIGPDKDIRTHSMYAQAEEYILKLIQQSMPSDPRPASRGSGLSSHGRTSAFKKKKRLFITGHSLGGAMGTSKFYIQELSMLLTLFKQSFLEKCFNPIVLCLNILQDYIHMDNPR